MEEDLIERITVNPKVMVGKPTIRGLRITVELILEALAAGVPEEDILADYPELEPADLRAAIAYGPHCLQMEQLSAQRPAASFSTSSRM